MTRPVMGPGALSMMELVPYRCTRCGYRERAHPESNWTCPRCEE